MSEKVAVFAGSFDPITNGHLDIINRALFLFNKIIIAIGKNQDKKYMFSIEHRKLLIEHVFANEPKIEVDIYTGLTVEYCNLRKVDFLLRGLRNLADFEFEKAIVQTNRKLASNIETVFLLTSSSYSHISSSIVRDIIKNSGDYSSFIPKQISRDMLSNFKKSF